MEIKENIKENIIKTGNQEQYYKNSDIINFIIDVLNDGYYETLNLFDMNIENNIYIEIDLNIKDLERLNIIDNNNIYEFLNIELDNYLFLDQYNDDIILLMDLLNIDLTDIYYLFEESKDYLKCMDQIEQDTLNIIKEFYNLNNDSNSYNLTEFNNIIDVFYKLGPIDEYYYYTDSYNDLIINLKDEFIYNNNYKDNLNNNSCIIGNVSDVITENYLCNMDNLLYDVIKNKLDSYNKFNVNYKLDLFL